MENLTPQQKYYRRNCEKIKAYAAEYQRKNRQEILAKRRQKKYCDICDKSYSIGYFEKHITNKTHQMGLLQHQLDNVNKQL